MSLLRPIQEHLNRWMLAYVSLAILAGLAVGNAAAGWTKTNAGPIGGLTTAAVFLIIYPMMVNVRFEALLRAGRNLRGIAIALAFNFLWAPLVGWVLATVFLPDPLLALGFLLVMVVPCSSMAIGYTGLAKGDLELATVVVAVSFLLAIVAVPLWMAVFASGYGVAVPMGDLINSILTVLVAPMVLGYLTRRGLVRWLGGERFAAIGPLFPALSLVGLYAIVFLIFFGKATMILDRWQTVAILLVPNAIFIALSLAVLTWLDRRLHLGYAEHMAVAFTATGKNPGTAIAIATTAFSPLVAIPAATMPIFQILFLVLYLRAAPRLRAWFGPRVTPAEPTVLPRTA
jgi:ACR3 family arsenite transporter